MCQMSTTFVSVLKETEYKQAIFGKAQAMNTLFKDGQEPTR